SRRRISADKTRLRRCQIEIADCVGQPPTVPRPCRVHDRRDYMSDAWVTFKKVQLPAHVYKDEPIGADEFGAEFTVKVMYAGCYATYCACATTTGRRSPTPTSQRQAARIL